MGSDPERAVPQQSWLATQWERQTREKVGDWLAVVAAVDEGARPYVEHYDSKLLWWGLLKMRSLSRLEVAVAREGL